VEKKISMLQNVKQGFGLEQSLWKDLSSGKFENSGAVEDIWAQPKRKELTEYWSKFRNEELQDLCFSTNIVWVNTSRTLRLAGHLALMAGNTCMQGFVWKILTQPDFLEDPDVDWRIVLKWILKQEVWRI
jgi:hypothetical protein